MNPADGSILGRRELRGDQAALFGRRVLAWNKYLILPTDSALIFLNADNISENGKSVVSLTIPNGSRMTPAFWNNRIIIVDQRGNLLYIDPVTKSISRSISTDARQPIGQAPTISGNTAVFSGRRGVVVAVNLQRAEVLWSQPLNNSGAVKVHTDALIHNGIVYLYGENVLYALNLADGKYVFPPVSGVSAAPEIVDNVLYLCRDNGIITIHIREAVNISESSN
jgi:outer membrane protein assembly factor BamB